ncbi:Unknown protein sequence [Pseudomonas syringae pv. maculicola]|nr:Unknown protein sequence [Pseudomonas syringae pv. maculicola]
MRKGLVQALDMNGCVHEASRSGHDPGQVVFGCQPDWPRGVATA